MTINHDAYYQYSDGRDMLSITLMQRDNLLRELEALAKEPQGTGGTESIAGFDIVKAQSLLYEISIIAEEIDSLIVQINLYSEIIKKPRVEITQGKPI